MNKQQSRPSRLWH